ncbi:MAG: sarcosine oxidase subunit gamma [Bradyrhizobiaceae bacterium]|nr:MAG: sarcosine oxidase subunit gamma [Bradyrhizobiaceae bacterium]
MPDVIVQRASSLSHLASQSRAVPAAELVLLPESVRMAFRGRGHSIQIAGGVFGVDLPQTACRMNCAGSRSAFWLGPDEWLLQESGESAANLYARLSAALDDCSHSLVDVSDRSETFSISGVQSEYILNHGCALDLSIERFPVGSCTRTLIGKAAVILSRPDTFVFHIDVWRSFAPYTWQLLDEARSELA